MQPRNRSFLAVALCGAAALMAGHPAAGQTLTQALAYAYQTNPQLLAQRALLRATDEQVPQALSNWRPTVNFAGETGFLNEGVHQTHKTSQYINLRPSSLQLQLTQPIYRGGRTVAETRRAINDVESQRAQTLAVETAVFQAVVKDYLDVVEQQTLVQVAINNEQVLRKELQSTEDRFRVGEVTRTDVAQAESSLAQATATRIAGQGNLRVVRANFARDVGIQPGTLLMPRSRPALPKTLPQAIRLAATANPSVISAEFTEAAARANVAFVRGQLLPQISVVGTLQRAYDESSLFKNVWVNSAEVLAEMTMPLYEGGLIYSETRAAEQTVGQDRSNVDNSRRAAIQSATQAWETLTAARASIASYATAVRAAQIALQGVQQEALVGTRTVLDVLIQNQQLFTTQSQLVTAQHDAALAEFNLAAATGRLVAADLHLPVKLYDMDQHYREVKDKWIGFGGGLKE